LLSTVCSYAECGVFRYYSECFWRHFVGDEEKKFYKIDGTSAPASVNAKKSSMKKAFPAIAAAVASSADGSETELTSPEKKSAASLGVALRNLLKLPKAHKWVCYEFFYSNLDKVLFEGENDFMVKMS